MTINDFSSVLDEVQSRYASQIEELQSKSRSYEDELQQISSLLHELETQRDAVAKELHQSRQLINALAQDEISKVVSLLSSHFLKSRNGLEAALRSQDDKQTELENQINSLLAKEPGLLNELQEYNVFKANKDVILDGMTPYYRTQMLDVHRALETRLVVLMELTQAIEQNSLLELDSIPIIQTVNRNEDQIFWALPISIDVDDVNGFLSSGMGKLENAFLKTITSLAGRLETLLPGFEKCEWAGYRGLTTLGESQDNRELADIVQKHIEQHLPEVWPFKTTAIRVNVIPVNWDVWNAASDTKNELNKIIPDMGKTTHTFDIENSLFRARDILAWDRPLRVGPESLWNVNARRLRTMFTRFLAQGRVGRAGLSARAVLEGLPEEHHQAFRLMLPLLEERGILLRESAEGDLLFINPDSLTDVQDLINRDIAPFWASITSNNTDV